MVTEISDWNDLDNVRNDLDGDYVLVNDLDENTAGYDDLAGPDANGGDGWEPIGEFFFGSLDGQGYVVNGLTIDRENGTNVGLINTLEGTIENISFTNIDITGEGRVGGIAGGMDFGGEISRTYVEGHVSGSFVVGGLVGEIDNSSISESYTDVNVDATGNNIGGLVGEADDSEISKSYSIGSVRGNFNVGAFIGENNSGSTISESYATGDLVGDFDGGFAGDDTGTISDSYWDTEATGKSEDNSDDTVGLTTAEMQGSAAETNMGGFDFTGTWVIVQESDEDATDDGYPILTDLDRSSQLESQEVFFSPFYDIASDPHGNESHSETFAVDGDTQPPEEHGDPAHEYELQIDGETIEAGDVINFETE